MSNPHTLVSLLDMLNVNAEGFVAVTRFMAYAHGGMAVGGECGKGVGERIAEGARQLIKTLSNENLPASISALNRIVSELSQKGGTTTARLASLIESFDYAFEAELRNRRMWIFNTAESGLMDNRKCAFGELVNDVFPQVAEDIEEATICLSLNRYVACVFHLMRAMEKCVQVIGGVFTGISHDKPWGSILSDIGEAVKLMPKGPKKVEWQRAHAMLYAVKEAWRNDVMHPKQTYTQDQASEVYDSTKAFIRQLATLVVSEAP